jgi:MarR family transcriptional regulator for hemolysin
MPNYDQTLMHLTMTLTQVARAYKVAADKMSADFGLSQATAWPAVMIGRLGDRARPGAVAETLGLEPSSVVRVIDQLIAAGLVERREDMHDRRARILQLTEEGRRRVADIEKALIPFRRQLFQDLDPADLQACQRVLDNINRTIKLHETPEPAGKA